MFKWHWLLLVWIHLFIYSPAISTLVQTILSHAKIKFPAVLSASSLSGLLSCIVKKEQHYKPDQVPTAYNVSPSYIASGFELILLSELICPYSQVPIFFSWSGLLPLIK